MLEMYRRASRAISKHHRDFGTPHGRCAALQYMAAPYWKSLKPFEGYLSMSSGNKASVLNIDSQTERLTGHNPTPCVNFMILHRVSILSLTITCIFV